MKFIIVCSLFLFISCSGVSRNPANTGEGVHVGLSCEVKESAGSTPFKMQSFELSAKEGSNHIRLDDFAADFFITAIDKEFLYRSYKISVSNVVSHDIAWGNLGNSDFWVFATSPERYDRFEFPEALFTADRRNGDFRQIIINCTANWLNPSAFIGVAK